MSAIVNVIFLIKVEFVYKNDKKHHVKYIKYIKNTGASITTIGYARKSCGNEPVAVRARLLQNMVNRLRKRGRCFKIFVSPQSNADELLAERDVRSNFEMKQLTNVKGTMQGKGIFIINMDHIITIRSMN